MEYKKSNSMYSYQNGKQSYVNSKVAPLQTSQLMKLFEEELKDIYWAEIALLKAIPTMINNSTSDELFDALENHLDETGEQILRIEQVFEFLGKKATAKKCEAMEGLIKEAKEIMNACEEGAMRDAGIISAGQKIEHYEIASYGTLCQFAETLGLTEVVLILEVSLHEEKAADKKLSAIATTAINMEAAHQEA
jgi:ferritin-like metal-binding protein YciE